MREKTAFQSHGSYETKQYMWLLVEIFMDVYLWSGVAEMMLHQFLSAASLIQASFISSFYHDLCLYYKGRSGETELFGRVESKQSPHFCTAYLFLKSYFYF